MVLPSPHREPSCGFTPCFLQCLRFRPILNPLPILSALRQTGSVESRNHFHSSCESTCVRHVWKKTKGSFVGIHEKVILNLEFHFKIVENSLNAMAGKIPPLKLRLWNYQRQQNLMFPGAPISCQILPFSYAILLNNTTVHRIPFSGHNLNRWCCNWMKLIIDCNSWFGCPSSKVSLKSILLVSNYTCPFTQSKINKFKRITGSPAVHSVTTNTGSQWVCQCFLWSSLIENIKSQYKVLNAVHNHLKPDDCWCSNLGYAIMFPKGKYKRLSSAHGQLSAAISPSHLN